MTSPDIESSIRVRLKEQKFGVLSTVSSDGRPHSTIVCFVSDADLKTIVVVTPETTRKFRNLMDRPQATFFFDDRTASLADLNSIWGIEAQGRIRRSTEAERRNYREIFLRKYPALIQFADSESSYWCVFGVDYYDVVYRFQDVFRFQPEGSHDS